MPLNDGASVNVPRIENSNTSYTGSGCFFPTAWTSRNFPILLRRYTSSFLMRHAFAPSSTKHNAFCVCIGPSIIIVALLTKTPSNNMLIKHDGLTDFSVQNASTVLSDCVAACVASESTLTSFDSVFCSFGVKHNAVWCVFLQCEHVMFDLQFILTCTVLKHLAQRPPFFTASNLCMGVILQLSG